MEGGNFRRSWNDGFVMLPNEIWDLGLSPGLFMMYCYFLYMTNKYNAIFPSFSTIAKTLGISERSAKTYIKELAAWKLLTIESGKEKGTSNQYTLNHVRDGRRPQ